MSPRTDEEFKEIRDIRQQQLKDAAIVLFGMKGYAATKISDITGKAELSHGLFYHYFKSKEDVYIAVIKELLDILLETIEKSKKISNSPLLQLEWLTDITHSGSLKEGVYRHIVTLQALYSEDLPQEMKTEIVSKYNFMIEEITGIIKKGQQAGEFIEGDPEELAFFHLSLVNGLLLLNARRMKPIEVSAKKVLRQLIPYREEGASQ